jgi:site-specific recombinase XerD
MFLNGFDTDNRLENEVAHNHAMKQMQKLRTIYKTAIDNGWVQKNPFASIKIRFEDVEREFLTKEELARIMQKEFPTERMERIRDVFIFCCFTGLSHCDVLKLHQEDIRTDDNGNLWIHTHRNKTDVAVDVPLLEIPQMILAKYKNKRKLRRRLLPVISNGCTNVYLKELGEACGIRKNITFHMARHTFATTVTLTNGVPIESVCKMLGHRNIRTTQIYAKVINEKIAQDMSLLASRIGSDYSMPRTKKRATA